MASVQTTDWIPYLSIDGVVFGFHANELRVLLLRWTNTQEWCLPGGFIDKAEAVDEAAHRVVSERTGLDKLYLQQFHVFGAVRRYDQADTLRRINIPEPDGTWPNRTISIGYYALVDYERVVPTPDVFTDECRWWSLPEVPPLLFDHNDIVRVAYDTLRRELPNQPMAHLLPPSFTITELQRLHETILGEPLDARNFYKKMMASGTLERLTTRRVGTPHKAPYLYRFVHDLSAS